MRWAILDYVLELIKLIHLCAVLLVLRRCATIIHNYIVDRLDDALFLIAFLRLLVILLVILLVFFALASDHVDVGQRIADVASVAGTRVHRRNRRTIPNRFNRILLVVVGACVQASTSLYSV